MPKTELGKKITSLVNNAEKVLKDLKELKEALEKAQEDWRGKGGGK